MLNLKVTLAEDIAAGIAAAQEAGALPPADSLPPVVVKQTDNPEHGDYASPVALALTKHLKKPPMELIEAIVAHMPKAEYIGRLNAAEPGFLNIHLNPGWLTARLDDVVEQDACLDVTIGEGKRYNFEFISANPTGPLTLGNVRTAFSVDTLANVLECAGFTVEREYYINDAGAQVKKLGESVIRRVLQDRGEKVEYADELYQGDYINSIGATLAEQLAEDEGKEYTAEDLESSELVMQVGHEAARLLLAAIKETIEQDLKITFDIWMSEQQLRESGAVERSTERLRARKATYTKEGTEYLRTTEYGDSEDRVLVKRDGEYAYIAPDIAYHHDKFERGFDGIFTFVGADHQGHAPKLFAAMEALGHDTKKLHVIAAQWLRFVRDGKPVKLSKRRGNIYTPKELIDEVGYDATRYFMVMHALTTHMDFDLELAKEQSDRNPVYYVQYAYVRLQSILRRAKQEGVIAEIGETVPLRSDTKLTHTAELALMRELYRFPEVIADIAGDFQIQALPHYAHELARTIHRFYKHVPVLAAEEKELVQGRLQLVLAARSVLGRTLDLLGISKPDVM